MIPYFKSYTIWGGGFINVVTQALALIELCQCYSQEITENHKGKIQTKTYWLLPNFIIHFVNKPRLGKLDPFLTNGSHLSLR